MDRGIGPAVAAPSGASGRGYGVPPRQIGACGAVAYPEIGAARSGPRHGGPGGRATRPSRGDVAASAGGRPHRRAAPCVRRPGYDRTWAERLTFRNRPRRTWKQRLERCALIALTRPGPDARRVGAFVYSTSRSTSPSPTTSSSPRRPSSTTTTARPSSAATRRRTATPSRSTRCRGPQGRGRGRGEPVLLHRQRHRPQGHPARGVQQRQRRRPAGRLDDHPAVRQDPLPDPGALLQAQDQGSDPVAEDPARAQQGRGAARATSTPSTSAAAPTASRPPPRRTSTKRRPTSTCAQSAVLASVLNNPSRFDPANGKEAKQARAQGALRLRARPRWPRSATSPPRRRQGREAAAEVPRRSRRESTYGGQKGHMLAMVKKQCSATTKKDGSFFTEQEIDGGGLRITTTLDQKAMAAAEQGVWRPGPRASATRSCTSGSPASSPARARCAASTPARTT